MQRSASQRRGISRRRTFAATIAISNWDSQKGGRVMRSMQLLLQLLLLLRMGMVSLMRISAVAAAAASTTMMAPVVQIDGVARVRAR